jgi:hypothetical protein
MGCFVQRDRLVEANSIFGRVLNLIGPVATFLGKREENQTPERQLNAQMS